MNAQASKSRQAPSYELGEARPEFMHPDATGGRPCAKSRFVEVSPSGTPTVTTVLRWESGRGWSQHIKDLPRAQPRPAVYCPYCGMKGEYAHTDKHKYFRHGNGEQFCVEAHRMTALHRRAQVVLRDGMRVAREGALPLSVGVACTSCNNGQTVEVLARGAWETDDLEVPWRSTSGDAFRLDVAATRENRACVALEVRVSHAVDGQKIAAFEAAELPFLELDADALVGLDGAALWQGNGNLPAPLVWRLPGVDCPHACATCDTTAVPPTPTIAVPDPSPEQALGAWAEHVERYGLKLTAPCVRCGSSTTFPLTNKRTAVEVVLDEQCPPRARVLTPDRPPFDVVICDDQPDQETGCIAYDDVSAVVDAVLQHSPIVITARQDRRVDGMGRRLLICRGCRRASDSARAVDLLWAKLSDHVPELVPRLRRSVEKRTDLAEGTLDEIVQPFAASIDAKPDAWSHRSAFRCLASRGFAGRVHGTQLLAEVLELPGIEDHWDDIESATSDPHGHLAEVLASGAKVPLAALVLADRLAARLQLPPHPSRESVWVLEAVVDANGTEHTVWTEGIDRLARRAYHRWKKAYGSDPAPDMRHSSQWIESALTAGQLVKEKSAGVGLALRVDAEREWNIAKRLRGLNRRIANKEVEVLSPRPLHARQEEAVLLAASNKLAVITGGAGTGKTTVLASILDTLPGERWIVLAPTGKAVQRVKEAVGARPNLAAVLTVAKALSGIEDTLVGVTGIIVDEVGFLDLSQFHKLLDLAHERLRRTLKRVVLVGDPNQLPSIGAGRVLADLLEARTADGDAIIPCVTLEEGFRAQEDIAQFADSVLRGEPRLDLINHQACPPTNIVRKVQSMLANVPEGEPLPQVPCPPRPG